MTEVNTAGNVVGNAVGITLNPGQVSVGKLTNQIGSFPFGNHGNHASPGIETIGSPWFHKDLPLDMIRSSACEGFEWKDMPLKDVDHIGRLAYAVPDRYRICYGYRPTLVDLHSRMVIVKLFPDSEHFVFALFGKEEIEIFSDATIPMTEEIHTLVMFNGKWLTLLKYLERAGLIEV